MATVQQEFTLYACQRRIYAENADGKLIDVGAVHKQGNGYVARLDADGVSGESMESIERALADLQTRITYLYLDGQFTALPDQRDRMRIPEDAPRVRIALTDTVDLPRVSADAPPHLF